MSQFTTVAYCTKRLNDAKDKILVVSFKNLNAWINVDLQIRAFTWAKKSTRSLA